MGLTATEWATVAAAGAGAVAAIAAAVSAVSSWKAARASEAMIAAGQRQDRRSRLYGVHNTLQNLRGGLRASGTQDMQAAVREWEIWQRELRIELLMIERDLPKCSELVEWKPPKGSFAVPTDLIDEALAEVEAAMAEERRASP